MAVRIVFCALMTTTGKSGRALLMRGMRSKPLSSGRTTSVMTRSPSPADTQRHKPAAVAVVRTSYPERPNAWLSTVRIAESSSATRIVPLGISSSFVSVGHGQENAEGRPPRDRLAFDDAAMVADNFCNKRQSETGAAALCRDKRIEDVRHQIGRHACTIVPYGHLERQAETLASNRGAKANAR